MNCDAYLFGQVLATHSFLLRGGFLKPDEYSEIDAHYCLPGGETGTAATVLSSLGVSARMDGTWLGTDVAPLLKDFYKDKNVDLSLMHCTDETGVVDYVVIAGLVRSPMGRFQTLFSSGKRWWNIPEEEDIRGCKVAAIDPYFGEASLRAADICGRLGVPYVTIDCAHDSPLHAGAAVNAVSVEFASQHYAGMAPEEIMALLQESTDGLVILTQGAGEMLYGRKGEEIKRMKPFSVEVKSTLGAGDTFKAGCVYGLLKGMSDDELVRFASACAGVAISRFPLPLYPPKTEEVNALINTQKQEWEMDQDTFVQRYIVSKDLKAKLKESGHRFSEREMAAIIWNSTEPIGVRLADLGDIAASTDDKSLAEQIGKRLSFEKDAQELFTNDTQGYVYALNSLEFAPEEDIVGYYAKSGLAYEEGCKLGADFEIVKYQVISEGSVRQKSIIISSPLMGEDASAEAEGYDSCVAKACYDSDGTLTGLWSREPGEERYREVHTLDNKWYENSYVVFPEVFSEGDPVRVVGTDEDMNGRTGRIAKMRFGHAEMNARATADGAFEDYSDAALIVEFMDEITGEICHMHVNPIFLEKV